MFLVCVHFLCSLFVITIKEVGWEQTRKKKRVVYTLVV